MSAIDFKKVRVDKILWYVTRFPSGAARTVSPLCPVDEMRLDRKYPNNKGSYSYLSGTKFLYCEECKKTYKLPRNTEDEEKYIKNKLDSKLFKEMTVLNLDDEAVPVAKSQISQKDSKYFVTAALTKSKVGLRLVIYAGERGKTPKAQIFVEPEVKRLAFDQNNLHPTEVFTSLEATFPDGSTAEIKKKKD